jgi:oxalate---CoA ligase
MTLKKLMNVIPPNVLNNTYSFLALYAAQSPDAIAIEAPERLPLSYRKLYQNIQDIILSLQTIGVGRGDRVAIVLPNGPEMSLTLLAVSALAVSAPLNPLSQLKEFETYLSDLKVKYLITQSGVESKAYTAASRVGIKVLEISIGKQSSDGRYQLFPKHIQADSCDMIPASFAKPEETAIILQTSGTTSRPKIIPLTHHNICVSVNYICQALSLCESDKCLSMMPQFHIGGFVDLLLAPLARGGSVLCTSGFNTIDFYSFLKKYTPTWYQAVPATLYELLAYAEKEKISEIKSSLRLIRSVAAPLNPQMMNALEALFCVPVIETYGMTEAAPLITTNHLPPAQRKAGSVGKSVGPEVVIMDQSGKSLPKGEIGEVVIRGENVISGYEGTSEVNDQIFRDGWLHTGDLGYLDEEGYLFLKGRIKEIINRGGEKISPQEIDAVLLKHPAVAEAISFSIPHSILGEDIAAAVVLKEGMELHRQDLIEFAAKRLSFFKVPRTVYFTEYIPKGPTGKAQRIEMASKLNLAVNVSSDVDYAPARTAVEAQLADIWTKLLKLNRVGIYDNFFDLGGDSLRAVELFLEIEKKFSHTLPLYTIFRFSTIAELSNIIEDKDPAKELLRRISKPSGKRVFWISYCFGSRDVPVIPLETYWEKSPEKNIEDISIEEMAANYVIQIQRYKDKGPYYLGGYSIGGLIALETARQLMNSGEEVPLLFLIDPEAPGKSFETKAMRKAHCRKDLSLLNTQDKILYITKKIGIFVRYLNFIIKKPACRLFFKFNKPLPPNLRMNYALHIYSCASTKYSPPEYNGVATIYLVKSHCDIKRDKWRCICPNADIHIIETYDHFEIIKPPWDSLWLNDLQNKLKDGNGAG